jgi:hypothetical protein
MTDSAHRLRLGLIIFFGALISISCLLLTRTEAEQDPKAERGAKVQEVDRGGKREGERGLSDETLDEGEDPASGPEWEGQVFPRFLQVPRELEGARVLACDEVLLDNGRTLRLSVFAGESGEGSLLFIEMGDGYGGVSRRGVFDPSLIRIEHDAADNNTIFHRLSAIGLEDQAMSSTRDGRISVQAPHNPLLILEFLGAVQSWLQDEGQAQLVPARPGWGDIAPSHGDRFVLLK